MLETNIIEAVTERDIDMLILEEFIVSKEFSKWFYLENHFDTPLPDNAQAFHSITDAELGESDLVVLYENGHAILIENKIGAIAQRNQAKRYVQRGEKGIPRGFWSSYSTCIIAPKDYLESTSDAQHYQSSISYESLRDWFGAQDTKRYEYRKFIFNEAIEQNRRGYTVIPDARVTAFWKDYWEYSVQNYPDLNMKQPGKKPANASFINFFPESLPKTYQLVHKLIHGFVDLQIPNIGHMLDEVIELFSDMEIEIAKANKSIAFRKRLQKMDIYSSFKDQEHIVEIALHEAKDLAAIAQEVWTRMAQIPKTKVVKEKPE